MTSGPAREPSRVGWSRIADASDGLQTGHPDGVSGIIWLWSGLETGALRP